MNGGAFGLEGGLAVTVVLAVSSLLMLFRDKKGNSSGSQNDTVQGNNP